MTKRELQRGKEYIRRNEEIHVTKRLCVSWGTCKKHSAMQNSSVARSGRMAKYQLRL